MKLLSNLIPLIYILILTLTTCSERKEQNSVTTERPAKELTVAQKIANVYGTGSFDKVNSIKFTFNVQKGEKQVHRTWFWEPKTGLVKFLSYGKDKPFTYLRNQLSENPTDELKNIDAKFINDQYWLLFPLHLVMDENVSVKLEPGLHKLPIGEGQARLVTVEYSGNKGYTPNDRYELYIDDNYKIVQWIYRRNNSPTPTRLTKWENYNKIGPLYLSLNRPGKDGSFRVWFTGVGVK